MRGALLTCVVALGFAQPSLAQPVDPEGQEQVFELLERMRIANNTLNYAGTLVYQHGDQVEVLGLQHLHENGVERERLISKNGKDREVVRDENAVTCINHGERSMAAEPRLSRSVKDVLQVPPEQLTGWYAFGMEGEAVVAGRDTMLLGIKPRDAYRYGVVLYLDKESALPLKVVFSDPEGQQVSQLMFADIIIKPSDGHIEEVEAADQRARDLESKNYRLEASEASEEVTLDKGELEWFFADLPMGFKPRAHMRRGPQGQTLQMLVSDGLAVLSVYVEPARAGEEVLEGPANLGPLNAFGRKLDEYLITSVGEVPPRTARAVNQAVRRRDASDAQRSMSNHDTTTSPGR